MWRSIPLGQNFNTVFNNSVIFINRAWESISFTVLAVWFYLCFIYLGYFLFSPHSNSSVWVFFRIKSSLLAHWKGVLALLCCYIIIISGIKCFFKMTILFIRIVSGTIYHPYKSSYCDRTNSNIMWYSMGYLRSVGIM